MAETITPFQMSRISIQGGIGAGLLIAVVVGSMLADLPLLRAPTLTALAGGLLMAAALIGARRQHPLDAATPPVSLGLAADRRRPR